MGGEDINYKESLTVYTYIGIIIFNPIFNFYLFIRHQRRRNEKISNTIKASATSRYTSLDKFDIDDFKCPICLNFLNNCVTIMDCGHNFCAGSNKTAASLNINPY